MKNKGTKWNSPVYNFNLKSSFPLGTENDFCWPWMGSLDKDGYGVATLNKRKTPAHVVAYTLAKKAPEEGMYVLHTCNYSSCVNPAHLYEGTQKQNIQDQINNGTFARGSKNGMAKLTEEEVKTIRERSAYYNLEYLAKAFKVSYYTIWDIVKGRSWKHLK